MDQDDKGREIKEILLRLISFKSSSGKEKEILDFLLRYLRDCGFEIKKEIVMGDRYNLIGIRGNPEFLISTHVDTVPRWGHPHAYRAKVEGETIWGRGAVDTKGQIASLLVAVKNRRDLPCAIAFFIDEEEEGRGSLNFSPPINFRGAVVLEPTDLKIATRQAGSIELLIECRGRCAHGAVPGRGKNAIEIFYRVYKRVKDLSFLQERSEDFKYSGINIGKIRGGIDCQVVAPICKAELDIPIFEAHHKREVFQVFEELKDKYQISYEIEYMDMPYAISKKEKVVERLSEAVKKEIKVEFTSMPAWTDAANLFKKGIPSVIFGAGRLDICHCPDERIGVKELVVLCRIIENFLSLEG
ncbi:MAG TPA: M20/M25/M40 family metallo-hydrolase [Desulfobacteraceae bacterium]|nr:M20/M25/M40 family metallo-hydrolase [Desulfobacteraceae bacterium]